MSLSSSSASSSSSSSIPSRNRTNNKRSIAASDLLDSLADQLFVLQKKSKQYMRDKPLPKVTPPTSTSTSTPPAKPEIIYVPGFRRDFEQEYDTAKNPPLNPTVITPLATCRVDACIRHFMRRPDNSGAPSSVVLPVISSPHLLSMKWLFRCQEENMPLTLREAISFLRAWDKPHYPRFAPCVTLQTNLTCLITFTQPSALLSLNDPVMMNALLPYVKNPILGPIIFSDARYSTLEGMHDVQFDSALSALPIEESLMKLDDICRISMNHIFLPEVVRKCRRFFETSPHAVSWLNMNCFRLYTQAMFSFTLHKLSTNMSFRDLSDEFVGLQSFGILASIVRMLISNPYMVNLHYRSMVEKNQLFKTEIYKLNR